jgi:hypothetical protein
MESMCICSIGIFVAAISSGQEYFRREAELGVGRCCCEITKKGINTVNIRRLPVTHVKNLPCYGKKFPLIPWTLRSKIHVSFVFAKCLFNELGIIQFLAFWLLLPFRFVPVYKRFRDGFRLMGRQFGFIAEIEWILLVIIYRVLAKKQGREKAYHFAKKAIQESSQFMMNDFYQADRLAEFEDPYEAFWIYHKAMFQEDPNYPNEFIELTIPELAPLGCDHDITGYKSIEDKTEMEFRRPVTLAKDGKPCHFMFYRKGTAPKGEYEIH